MYESYWHLRQKPFENAADPRFYYPGESHQAALLKLRYAIESRRGAALLAGVSGTGKTLLVNMLRESVAKECTPFVHLVFPQMSTDELLAYLAEALDSHTQQERPAAGRVGLGRSELGRAERRNTERASDGPAVSQSIRRIERCLAANVESGKHAVVAVDEAHLIDCPETLEALRLLLNFQPAGQPGLTLLLTGQTGLLPILERTPQLDERLGVKWLVRPFTQQETADYVAHRLTVAGAQQQIFEPDALPTLHALTHGIARRINRLCDLTLLIGFAEEQSTITAAHCEAVCQELVAVVPE